MRLVSLVPSWTETLIHAGAEVVGRTRYCVHPAGRVRAIPVVGGTKRVDWQRVTGLRPDLLILDREENPRAMADEAPVPWMATHVTAVEDVEGELVRLAERLELPALVALAERWRAVQRAVGAGSPAEDWCRLPGVLEWIRRPEQPVERLLYLIWHDPWMAAARGTFIGSMLALLGYGRLLGDHAEQYPRIALEEHDPASTLLLFSSEPYPFARHRDLIGALPFPAALVDGESFGWYGLRALRFLETAGGR